MTDTTTTPPADDPSNKREQFKIQAEQLIDSVKQEVSQRLDQLLDELGAMI